MQDIVARFVVVFAVALQDFMSMQGVFECHERRIRLRFQAHKEDKRIFADHLLVVIYTPHAMVQKLSLAHKVGGCLCDNADERAALIVLQGRILLRDFAECLFKVTFCFLARFCLCCCLLIYADIVPAHEVVRKPVLRQGHIQL